MINQKIKKLSKELKKNFPGVCKFNEPLSKHTTFKIGGPAALWVVPKNIEALQSLIMLINKHKVPFFVLGKGSNVLIKDGGFLGVVISLNSNDYKNIGKENLDKGAVLVDAGSSVELRHLLDFCLKNSLCGYEFMAGIPGSLGGSLIMNAGTNWDAKAKNMGDLIQEVKVIDGKGEIKTFSRKQLRWGYRSSNLSKYIILSAKLRLQRAGKNVISKSCRDLLKKRCDSQDIRFPSAGCIFKNPSKDIAAGQLIDLCGFKGRRVGRAQVSLKHANFIVNSGGASAGDVLKLMRLINKKVRQRFGVELKPEVRII